MKVSSKILMGIIGLMVSPFLVHAQIPTPVRFSFTQTPQKVNVGETFKVQLHAAIDKGWHLYSINNDADAGPYPTKIAAANDRLQITGPVEESKPTVKYDPNFKAKLGFHTQEATFTIPLAFSQQIQGSAAIGINVTYQVCNDKICLPPTTKKITKEIALSGAAAHLADAQEGGNAAADLQKKSGVDRASKSVSSNITPAHTHTSSLGGSGFLSFLWIAITAGFAALLTPCVFPMIPLTVSFFSKQNEGQGRRAVLPALGFGAAVVATFTILGALLAAVIGVSGANRFASNPWVNLFIALVLIVFALSLLGAFEIRLPYQLTNWLNKKSNERSGFIGILFMALTISAVSFSCTAPFIGGVLAATAGGQWFYPIVGMIAFSAAFASPFVILALFPRWLESLPKSGSWMNIVKVLLGFIELAAAFKFLSNADLVWQWGMVSRPLIISAWIAIFLLAGLYILGVFVMKHEKKTAQIGTTRLILSIPFLLFSFYLIPGLLGANLGIWDAWLPPKQASDVSVVYTIAKSGIGRAQKNSKKWSDNYQASVKHANEMDRPVFIDFTGYTCTNCRAMEADVFPLEPVQNLLTKMELVRLYTDDGTDGPANQKFQFTLTGTVALPTYAIVDPKTGHVLYQQEGQADKKAFIEFLDRGLQKFQQTKKSI